MEKNRFELIMARVDAWADENSGWDCRDDAVNELAFCLKEYPDWSDEQLLDTAIAAWEMAE
jgi:hypothetical protein